MILEATDLARTFQRGDRVTTVLKDASLQLNRGESLAVVGPSGSGKTTLLSLLGGLDVPDSGVVRVAGQPISSLSEVGRAQLRAEHMGIIFQKFHLLPTLTAEENVALPLDIKKRSDAADAARATLAMVGLSHRLDHFPAELSGGECQRVAIARAMVGKPSVLLADEPSGNLDTETGNQVMDLLFKLVAENNMALLLVTHNPAHAERCARTVRIAGGVLR